MIKKINLIFFCLLVFKIANAQLLVDKVMPPSPDVVPLIKFCDHPVGNESGIPKTSILIHAIQHQDIILPITLNYHSLGVKVEEEASWVGLGWYLHYGGVITRMVRGKNDLAIAEQELNGDAKGYPFENIKPCLDDCDERKDPEFQRKVCEGLIDTDPDVFFFDILGRKGKFLLTPNNSTGVLNLKVQLQGADNMTATFDIDQNKWVVKDSQGYLFYFGTREITETQRNYFDYKFDNHKILFKYYSDVATTAWYLDQIKSPTGATIFFDYDVDTNGKSAYGTNGAHQRMNINDQDLWDVHYTSYCFPENIENVQILMESMYANIYPTTIRYGNNAVTFNKSDREDMVSPASNDRPRVAGSDFALYLNTTKQPQRLASIEILENGNYKKWVLGHGYFNSATEASKTPHLYKRLKLETLTLTGKKPHIFTYYDSLAMPSKESHARDLWGYYNGEETIHNITPSDFFNYNQPERILEMKDKNKHYSLEHVRTGALKSILYPSERMTEFFYEPQEYNHISEEVLSHYDGNMHESNFATNKDPFISGGLRVTKIIDTYPTDKLLKEFNYGELEAKGGYLAVTPFSHTHTSNEHKAAGSHYVKYPEVKIVLGKYFKGKFFKY